MTRGFVRQDVAEQVLGQDDVEPLRSGHERHRARVHVHVRHGDVGVVPGDLVHDLAPELRRLEHVGLVDRDELLAAGAVRASNATRAIRSISTTEYRIVL